MDYYLQIKTKTWDRRQNLNLFDHQQHFLRQEKFKINQSGIVVRDFIDFSIDFISDKNKQKADLPGVQVLFQVRKQQGLYNITNPKQSQESLFTLVPNLKNSTIEKFEIFQKDVIKIGKKEINILKLENQKELINAHYKPNASSFFSQLDQKFYQTIRSSQYNQSQLETLPCCRICLSHAYRLNNLITNCCSCLGSSKYIHKQCLSKWIVSRIKKNVLKFGVAYSINKQGAMCELCRKYFNFNIIMPFIFKQQVKIYCLLQIKDIDDELYILNFTEKPEIIIGRGNNTDLNLKDITASRAHCKILYDNERGKFLIRDLDSKFGTLIQMHDKRIKDTIQVQKGRTIIQITKKPQYNIIFKFMRICGFAEENTEQNESIK